MTIAIIDCGSGNLRSVSNAFLNIGADAVVTSDPAVVKSATHIVLPGVGAFGDVRAGLFAIDGMFSVMEEEILHRKKPFLGICVGMQLLADKGMEHGEHTGFGWISGTVEAITPNSPLPLGEGLGVRELKIPHMGWNNLQINKEKHPPLVGHTSVEGVKFASNKENYPPLVGGSKFAEQTLGRGENLTPKEIIKRAKELRSNLTEPEALLWYYLKNKQLGYKIRKQAPIKNYIVDFLCFEKKLIIELDGSQHCEQKKYDDKRTKFLEGEGFRVLRFWNKDVFTNMEGVLESILYNLNSPSPNPKADLTLPQGEGNKAVHALFTNLPDNPDVYFVHSYHFKADNPNDVIATVDYGEKITAAVARENIIGVQFHPEKSQRIGLTVLNNFVNM